MSFDNPLSFAQWQSSLASSKNANKPSETRSNRGTQSVWGQAGQQDSRNHGLTSSEPSSNLDTFLAANSTRSDKSEGSDRVVTLSDQAFPPLSSSSSRFGGGGGRSTLSRTSPAPLSTGNNIQPGVQQYSAPHLNRLVTSPRVRATTPSLLRGNNTTNNPAVGPGAGGGGGSGFNTRSNTYSPTSFNRNIAPSPVQVPSERPISAYSTTSLSSSVSQFSKISATQLNILLETISEKEGQQKWEAKAQKIRDLSDSNGPEVFAQFLRRTIALNTDLIFSEQSQADQGSYKLLQERVEKVRQDPVHARHIAEAINTAKEDTFSDFDLESFVNRLLPDSVSRAILTIAFTPSARNDLNIKAEKFLSDSASSCLQILSAPQADLPAISPLSLASVISHYATSSTISSDERAKTVSDILVALQTRGIEITTEIMSASQLWRLPDQDRDLLDVFRKAGPKSTSSKTAAEDVLAALHRDRFSENEVANTILFLVFSQPQHYNVDNFVTALRSNTKSKGLDWNAVVRCFDVAQIKVNPDIFSKIFHTLQLVAAEDHSFDIQSLWGGVWHTSTTQTAFLRAFLESADIAPADIPGFRSSLATDDIDGISTEEKTTIQAARNSHYASADAIKAIFDVILVSDATTDEEDGNAILRDLVANHLMIFVLSLATVCPPLGNWTNTQERFVEQCFTMYLEKRKPESELVLNVLFKQNPQFVRDLCTMSFHVDPRRTELIYRCSEEYGWTEYLLTFFSTPLAMDIACMRQKNRTDFDLEKYIQDAVNGQSLAEKVNTGNLLWKYLRIKADDEYRVQREQIPYQSVPLSLKSVFIFLWKLQELITDRDQLKAAQTTCLQTYPRLMNYGTGFDDVLERRSADKGNKLPTDIDEQMSELFGKMYRSEVSIRDMVTEMRSYKTSQSPERQDLFCCIVHGLFDEYVCYSEYPEEALEKTALLFGNIIKYKLLPPLPQDYGLTLIVDAVKDYPPESMMHRFGIEALLQVSDQLSEWPNLCALLLQIPTLQHPEILQRAQEGLQSERLEPADRTILTSETADAFASINGAADDALRADGNMRGFRSIQAESHARGDGFRDPDQKAQEKILFVINNLSKDNMSTKLSDLQEVLVPEHYQWFASYLVEQRARLEPNNQQMYYEFLAMLDDKRLMAEILRETFVSIVKMMNARSTVDSAVERSHLKSLGGWLGSLTLAQDKPIKHKNIYFIDLLIEGFETQRLVVVIPFTCKVLVQGARSMVFRPPNPWLMEIIGLLLELYHFAELKLNLKFEIEVLCKDLDLDHKKIEPSSIMRDRPQQLDDQMTNTSGLEGLDEFADLSLNARRIRDTLTAQDIMSTLPNLEEVLKYPPLTGPPQEQETIKTIIYRAFDRAIQEIIAPVVERSITIASISTAQLISKDYAMELDVDRYRNAARHMVKSLAGSLALVTCKEPLRMSITNYIRQLVDEPAGTYMPEGMILMSVNDNLEVACSFVREAAEERAIPEIDQVIDTELEDRRRFLSENPGREFFSQNVNRWSTWIPEPYKQTVGGLNEAQRAVYEDFDRRVHGMNAGHIQNISTDSTGRQLPDVLNETLAIANLSTPAEQPALPHQSPLAQQEPRLASTMQQPRMNGYADALPPLDRIAGLIDDIQKAARASSAPRLKDLEKNSSIFQDVRQILIVLTSSTRPTADHIARQIAEKICNMFLSKSPHNFLEAEFLAFLLHKLCLLSELIVRDVMRWITAREDDLLGNSWVTASLVQVGLMDFARIDGVISVALREHNEHGLQLLRDLMDQTLFSDEPIALRADFANSILALYAWLKESPDHPLAIEISTRLKQHGVPEYVSVALSDKAKAKEDQMRYIFKEWVALYENLAYDEGTYASFLRGLHGDQTINGIEDMATFLRLCIDSSIECFEMEAQSYRGSLASAFVKVDALALLIVLLVKFQGDSDGAVKLDKANYLDSILSLVVLILNHHQQMKGVSFNQRVFARLFNCLLFEYAAFRFDAFPEHNDLMLVFAKTLKALQPSVFPGFVFGWMSLICHRVLAEGMLKSSDIACTEQYRELVGIMLQYVAPLYESPKLQVSAELLYRAVWRNIFILRHDFPGFISENHAYFCSRISCTEPQLRNLILATRPHAFYEEPDPMTPGLKVERLEDMKKNPVIASDITTPLEKEQLKSVITAALHKNTDLDSCVKEISIVLEKDEDKSHASFMHITNDAEVLESLVLFVVENAVSDAGKFEPQANHVRLLSELVNTLGHRHRYLLLTAIADQLRYPNTHTDYFCKTLLHLWGLGNGSNEQSTVREVILRIVQERLLQHKPHPWGMIVFFQELTNNGTYGFWDMPFFANEPDVRQRLLAAVRGH